METKKILGLDIGTNSIGAALIEMPKSIDDFGRCGNIIWLGSRILPTDANVLQKFESGGQVETKAAARRIKRGSRRLKHRYKLRRTRLIKVFKDLGWVDKTCPLDDPKRIKQIINENNTFTDEISKYAVISDETYKEFYREFEYSNGQIEKILNEIHFRKNNNGKRNDKSIQLLPEDWIVYFLRKKALKEKITIPELIRVIYMFNQRRGFKSSRKDLKDEGTTEKKWVEILTIDSVQEIKDDSPKRKDGKLTFKVKAGNHEWEVHKKRKPEWEGKEFQLLFTEKNGKLNVKVPEKDDWELLMIALDNQIGDKHPGEYFFDKLVADKNYKIRQIAVRRERYKRELEAIWNKQIELRKKENAEQEILNENKIDAIAKMLYKNNETKQKELKEKGLLHIISNDIIYYQRELKSQKKFVGGCRYEKVKYKKNGEEKTVGVKVAPKSSPEFQEFRIWQDIHNLRIFEKEKIVNGKKQIDVELENIIDNSVKEKLFELFDKSAAVTQQDIFNVINKIRNLNLKETTHRINLFANRDKLKGNETKEYFRKAFRKKELNFDENKNEIKYDYSTEKLTAVDICEKLISDETLFAKLWHILYSITSSDKEKSEKGIITALSNPKNGFNLPHEIIEHLAKLPEIKEKQYASLSSKAIKKLLPLMRCGKYAPPIDDQINSLKISIDNQIHSLTEKQKQEKDEKKIKKITNKITGLEKLKESEITRLEKLKERAKEIYKRLESINFDEERINEVADDDIQKQILKSFINKKQCLLELKGLNTYQACYLVYGRHSERENTQKYNSFEEIDVMKLLPNNSLRNPIVEQVIRETLFLVKDVWKQYGRPDEIHIELGRELKKNAKEKEKIANRNKKERDEKERIKKMLYELINDKEFEFDTNPNPESPLDIEKFKVWKSTAGKLDEDVEKYFNSKDTKEKIPTSAEIKKYALWLSQQCKSPYTGERIPLSKLFTNEYEVEHIIPRSKLKYDAIDNLVICESGVNKLKGNLLARVFIQQKGSENPIEFEGKIYRILKEDEYLEHCKTTFEKSHYKKYKNLLSEEIPKDFISRQLNDTRYITRKLSELLYPIAQEKEGIVFTSGSITSELKREWGLNTVWKELLKPRFKRLEKIIGKTLIVPDEKDANKFHFNVPDVKDFDDKRIDHRHHAMDALIIAATTREHIRYLNSLNAVDTDEELKAVKLKLVKEKVREFNLPWKSFTKDAKNKLSEIIISIKTDNKVITKPKNKYIKWAQKEDGTWKKEFFEQTPNKKWLAVRKSMFKEPQGTIYLKEVITKKFRTPKEKMDIVKLQMERMKVQNTPAQKHTSYIYDQYTRELIKGIIELHGGNLEAIEKYLKKNKLKNINGEEINTVRIAVFNEYAAKRVSINDSFTEKKIDKIPYSSKSPLAKILRDHLNEYNNKPEDAFAGEGLDVLTKKAGRPIKKVTVFEKKDPAEKFKNIYYETDKGGNAFFVMYENENFERVEMHSISVLNAIENITQNKPLAEPKENHKIIILSPNDLVYVPTEDEWNRIKKREQNVIDWNDKKKIANRIYKMVSCTGSQCYFIPHNIAKPIDENFAELGSNDKSEKAWTSNNPERDTEGVVKYIPNSKGKLERKDDGVMIKEICIKIKVDRLGNIISVWPTYKIKSQSDDKIH
ncbi:MAG: hypothetical protein Fur0015_03780 [Ignavibacteriales bacterium]